MKLKVGRYSFIVVIFINQVSGPEEPHALNTYKSYLRILNHNQISLN